VYAPKNRVKSKNKKKKPKDHQKDKINRRREYNDYLNSPKWKSFRQSIIDARGYKCEKCPCDKGTLHLHHLHYRTFMNEGPEDVLLVCVPCHEKIHGKKIGRNNTSPNPKPEVKPLKLMVGKTPKSIYEKSIVRIKMRYDKGKYDLTTYEKALRQAKTKYDNMDNRILTHQ